MNEKLKKIKKFFAVTFMVGLTYIILGTFSQSAHAAPGNGNVSGGSYPGGTVSGTVEWTLTGDVTFTSTVKVTGKLTIKTNGSDRTINFTPPTGSSTPQYLFSVESGGTLVIDGGNNTITVNGGGGRLHNVNDGDYLENITSDNDYSNERRKGIDVVKNGNLTCKNVKFQNFVYNEGAAAHHIIRSAWQATGTVTLENCTFENFCAKNTDSSVLKIGSSARINVTGCKFYNCVNAGTGNVVRCVPTQGAKITFSGCEFERCTSGAEGGAIGCYTNGADITLAGCTFEYCSTKYYGGAVTTQGTFTFEKYDGKNNVFKYNRALALTTKIPTGDTIGGGAIFITGNTTLSADHDVSDCDIYLRNIECYYNQAPKGGAIAIAYSAVMNVRPTGNPINYNVYIEDVILDGNTATIEGGGIYISRNIMALPDEWDGYTHASITEVANTNFEVNVYFNGGTIKNNAAGKGGGVAIMNLNVSKSSTGTIILSNNHATDAGGALYIGTQAPDETTVYNTIHNSTKSGTMTEARKKVILDKLDADAKAILQVTLSNVQAINNNLADKNGGAICVVSGTFTLTDGQIENNEAKNGDGGGIYVDSRVSSNNNVANVVCTNVSILKNIAGGNGGGIYARSANITVSGIVESTSDGYTSPMVISYNTAKNSGGGIYLDSGNFTINGGLVRYNGAGYIYNANSELVVNETSTADSSNGGGVYVTNGTFSMNAEKDPQADDYWDYLDYGVRVNSNRALGSGGGFYVNSTTTGRDSVIELVGGTVYLNTADLNGGGMAVAGDGNITINAENVNINNNTAENHGGGVYVNNTAESGNNKVTFKMSGTVRLDNTTPGGFTSYSTLSYNTAKYGNGGGLYLNGGNFEIQGGLIRFNGAGYDVDYDYKKEEAVYELFAKDETTEDIGNGGGVYVKNGNFTLGVGGNGDIENGCRVNFNYARRYGGGFYVYSNKSDTVINTTLTGGTVVKNYADCGGGFSVLTDDDAGASAEITATDVYINDNIAETHGGGVYVVGNNANFTMSGKVELDANSPGNYQSLATISYNTARYGNGGGVYINGGNFKIDGGMIRFNGAGYDVDYDGIGVVPDDVKATPIYDEGTYTAKVSEERGNGGGVYVKNGNFTLRVGEGGSLEYGCRVNANYALRYGGGFYVYSTTRGENALIDLIGGTVIYNRASSGAGFGVFSENDDEATVNITAVDVNIMYNDVEVRDDIESKPESTLRKGYGGGILIDGNSNTKFEISTTDKNISYQTEDGEAKCSISHNTAVYGGGVSMNGGEFILKGVFIRNNNAIENGNIGGYGGGAYLRNASLTMTLGYVSYNNATVGGGFYILSDKDKAATVSLGKKDSPDRAYISYNTAKKMGGGFYLSGAGVNTTLAGDYRITRNTVEAGNGGGVYIADGSTFTVKGGTIYRNTAKAINKDSNSGLKANDFSATGVGGGIYLREGTFDMLPAAPKNNGDFRVAGIYSNTADFAADDMFSSGESTYFIAIPVAEMLLREDYILADNWFEDFPEGEEHRSLKLEDNGKLISSQDAKGRCRKVLVTNRDNLVRASAVEPRADDSTWLGYTGYACITMGPGSGKLTLSIPKVAEDMSDDQVFIFEIESSFEFSDDSKYVAPVRMTLIVSKEHPITVNRLPLGTYKIKLVKALGSNVTNWSWRFNSDSNITIHESSTDETSTDENRIHHTSVADGGADGEFAITFTIHSYVENNLYVMIYNQANLDWLTYNHYAEKGYKGYSD